MVTGDLLVLSRPVLDYPAGYIFILVSRVYDQLTTTGASSTFGRTRCGMFSSGDLVAAQWCLYRVLITENIWRYRDSDGGVLFVFLGAYGWDESLLLSWEGRVCRLATASLVGVLCLSPVILFGWILLTSSSRPLSAPHHFAAACFIPQVKTKMSPVSWSAP